MLKAVSFCPVTCLPSLVIKKSGDGSQKLKDCFCFDEEVKPGWIQYDPKKSPFCLATTVLAHWVR